MKSIETIFLDNQGNPLIDCPLLSVLECIIGD